MGGGRGTPQIRNFFWAKITIFSTFLRRFFGGMSVKGGGGTPRIRNLFFGENFVRKGGGGTPLTDKIRKVVFEVPP